MSGIKRRLRSVFAHIMPGDDLPLHIHDHGSTTAANLKLVEKRRQPVQGDIGGKDCAMPIFHRERDGSGNGKFASRQIRVRIGPVERPVSPSNPFDGPLKPRAHRDVIFVSWIRSRTQIRAILIHIRVSINLMAILDLKMSLLVVLAVPCHHPELALITGQIKAVHLRRMGQHGTAIEHERVW